MVDILNTSNGHMDTSTPADARTHRFEEACTGVLQYQSDPGERGTWTEAPDSVLSDTCVRDSREDDGGGALQWMNDSRKRKAEAIDEGLEDHVLDAWHTVKPGTSSKLSSATVGKEGGIPQRTADDASRRDLFPHEYGQDEAEELTVRHEEFYLDNADCVIRVDNTLFRVHRYLLGRDSSAFQIMFTMPAQDHAPSHDMEGCSDKKPIRLYEESVERFRALLSVIYSLPLQLQIWNTPAADVEQLLTIAEMMNKYHFVSNETWAVDALYNVISGLHGPPPPQYDLGHCSSVWMKRFLDIALLCGHAMLRNLVVDRWVDRIISRDLRPVHALEISDRSGIKRLQGYAYYVQLLEMDGNFQPGVVEDGKQYSRIATALAVVGPDENRNNDVTSISMRRGTPARLTRDQTERLLFGDWSLSRLWENLRTNPPQLQQSYGCTNHQQGCMSTWAQVWRDIGKAEATLKHPTGDVLGRLRTMEQQLFTNVDMQVRLSHALTPQCKRSVGNTMKMTIKEVHEGLADHFAQSTHTGKIAGANTEGMS